MFGRAGLGTVARLGAILSVVLSAVFLFSSSAPAAGASAAAGTSAKATPDKHLTNNDVVTVRGRGFTPLDTVVIVQCNGTTTTTGVAACDLSNVVFATADRTGRVRSTLFRVQTGTIGNGECVTSTTPISDNSCFIVVANESNPFNQVAAVPIVFKN